jgi:hypothetical protein
MHKVIVFLLMFVLLPCFYTGNANAQDFDCTVTLITDAIPSESKDRVKDMKQQLEDYFNKNKFYDNTLFNENNAPGGENYKIKAAVQVTFRGTDGLDNFDAQILVVSQRIIDRVDKKANPKRTVLFKYIDERCKFTYNRAMQFIENEQRFDSFLSLFDYYAYMMLGFDQDSFFPRDHPKNRSVYFQKAIDICNKPMQDRTGWTDGGGGSKPTRLQMVQEIMNPKYQDYRNAFYEYHWLGIDSLGLSKNAYAYMYNAIEKMSKLKKKEMRSYMIDLFFEAKAQEIADSFLNYGDKTIYDKIIQLDQAHQRIYEDAKKRAK